jgi:RNA polymerase sigma-70 factor, ECF subfamily
MRTLTMADRADPPLDADADALTRLVRAAAAGDRESFGVLYERYARFVHGILVAHADRGEAQDLLQDVFFRALQRLHTLRDPAAFGGWIATLARNEAGMRRRGTREHVDLTDQLPAAAQPGTLGTDEVLRALQSLPERYREPLTLRLVEEMGGEEIARVTGLTHGTVRVYLHHGLRMLRERLQEER